jgi:hypothetical protein
MNPISLSSSYIMSYQNVLNELQALSNINPIINKSMLQAKLDYGLDEINILDNRMQQETQNRIKILFQVLHDKKTHKCFKLLESKKDKLALSKIKMSYEDIYTNCHDVAYELVFNLHFEIPSDISELITQFTLINDKIYNTFTLSKPISKVSGDFQIATTILVGDFVREANNLNWDEIELSARKMMENVETYLQLYYLMNMLNTLWKPNIEQGVKEYFAECLIEYEDPKLLLQNEIRNSILKGKYDYWQNKKFQKEYAYAPIELLRNEDLKNCGILHLRSYIYGTI